MHFGFWDALKIAFNLPSLDDRLKQVRRPILGYIDRVKMARQGDKAVGRAKLNGGVSVWPPFHYHLPLWF